MHGEETYAFRTLVRKSEGKRPLGRPRRSLVDNIEMDLRDIGLGGMTGFIWLKIGTRGGLLMKLRVA
jgi:hypothetical protein